MNKLSPDRIDDIRQAVAAYAAAYDRLEKLQKAEKQHPTTAQLLPWHGDQKTGLIGEYWAIQYARHLYPKARKICFSRTNQKGWDIGIKHGESSREHLVQVKTTSYFSETGRLSPVHSPRSVHAEGKGDESWDELWVIQLDNALFPIGFWSVKETDLITAVKTQSAVNKKKEEDKLLAVPKLTSKPEKKTSKKAPVIRTAVDMFFPMSGITIPRDHSKMITPEWLGKAFTARHDEFRAPFIAAKRD